MSLTSQGLLHLRTRWALYTAASLLGIAGLFLLLQEVQSPAYARRWSFQAGAVAIAQFVYLWRSLPLNTRTGETHILPNFGPGNSLTLWRGTLTAMLAGFLFLPDPRAAWVWLPAILYLLSDLTDFLDGALARLTNTVTRLGEQLDMNYDALGVLVVTLLAFQMGSVPWWYVPYGFARYIFLAGLYLHKRRGLPVYPLRPNNFRRLLAGLQMGFITVMLFPVVAPPATTIAATVFLIPFAGIFAYDYWQVTGKLSQHAFWGRWNLARWRDWPTGWIPLILRGVIVLIYGSQARDAGWIAALWGGSASGAHLNQFFSLGLLLIFMLLFALGILGRITPIAALIVTGIQLYGQAVNLREGLLIFALIYILVAGTGKFSLWRPEDWLIDHRVGEKRRPENK